MGQIATFAISIASVRVITGLLSPEQYGIMALGATLSQFAPQLLFGPLSNGILRYYATAHERDELKYFWTATWILLKHTTLIALVIGITGIILLLAFGQQQWLPVSLVALALSVTSGYNSVLENLQQAARQRKLVAFHQTLLQVMRQLIAIGFVTFISPLGVLGFFASLLSSILVICSQLFFIRRSFDFDFVNALADKESFTGAYIEQLKRYAWPFMLWAPFTWLQLASDRWALQNYSSTYNVGLYTSLYVIGYFPIVTFWNVVTQFVTPIIFKRSGDGSNQERLIKANQASVLIGLGCIAVTMISFFIAHATYATFFSLFTGEKYHEVGWLFPWMLLSGGLFSAGQLLAITSMNRASTSSLISPKIATAIIGTLSNVIGAALFGLEGVVFASCLFSAIYLVWIFFTTTPSKLYRLSL